MKFDSKLEAERWLQLNAEEEAGLIHALERQVKFILVPSQYIDGKCVERECAYIADFRYVKNGKTIVEDTKGVRTPEYIIKRKLMLYVFGIKIHEVRHEH